MSSRTHNDFGTQFSHNRMPKFANKAALSVSHYDLLNTKKSITMVNKETRCFVSGNFL
jgi:hypothetical protein